MLWNFFTEIINAAVMWTWGICYHFQTNLIIASKAGADQSDALNRNHSKGGFTLRENKINEQVKQFKNILSVHSVCHWQYLYSRVIFASKTMHHKEGSELLHYSKRLRFTGKLAQDNQSSLFWFHVVDKFTTLYNVDPRRVSRCWRPCLVYRVSPRSATTRT